eukprot:c24313_g1_i1 orf=479-946(-)
MQVVEVQGPDGKAYRFAVGTKAGFAVERINAKLSNPSAEVLWIEATHPGENSVEFGPDADLASYGDGWSLHAVSHHPNGSKSRKPLSEQVDLSLLYPDGKLPRGRKGELTFEYVSKIVMCFLFMLIFGAILTTFLEQLPMLLRSFKHVAIDTHEL